MTWIKKNWWMIALLAFIAVTALVILIAGILTHKEAGLEQVCWSRDGSAQYSACEGATEPVIWDHLPITVHVEAYDTTEASLERGKESTRAAAGIWNDAAGLELIRLVDDPSADAVLVWGAPIDPARAGDGGWVTHHRVAGRMSAEVHIARVATSRLAYLITVHELGHLVGLAHDDFAASPMYPITRDDSSDSVIQFTRPTDYDRQLLRSTYVHH